MWSRSECPCSAAQRPHGALEDYCSAVCPAPGLGDFSRPRGPCSYAFLSHFPQGDSGSPGAGQIVRLSASGSSVCSRVSAPRSPAATAAGTREARQGRSREGPSPLSAASPRRGLTAELLGLCSRDATKKPAPTPCPEPPPSSLIPERSQRSLAACEAPCKGGARRRYNTRVGSRRAEGGVSSLGMGKAGRSSSQNCPHAAGSPQLGTLASLPACCQPHSPGVSPAPVGMERYPEVVIGNFRGFFGLGRE